MSIHFWRLKYYGTNYEPENCVINVCELAAVVNERKLKIHSGFLCGVRE